MIKFPNEEGMEPESEVAAAPNVVRLVNSPNCEGSSPVRKGLPPILNCCRDFKEPSCEGIEPLRRLS